MLGKPLYEYLIMKTRKPKFACLLVSRLEQLFLSEEPEKSHANKQLKD